MSTFLPSGTMMSDIKQSIESNPDTKMARITREQWQHFLDTYRPLENEVMQNAMQTDFTKEGDEAGARVRESLATSAGTLSRNLSRAGTSLTGEERAAVRRRNSLAMTKGVSRAENTTRRSLSDSRTNLLANLVSIGRGVQQTATGGMQTAADLAANRNMQHMQQKTQAQNQNLSMAAMIAMFAMSDERLKDNVELIGQVGDINVYSWVWNEDANELFGLEGPSIGVMAHEHPDYSEVGPHGYRMVNYTALFGDNYG